MKRETIRQYILRVTITSALSVIAVMMILFCLSSCSQPRHYNPRLDGYSVGQEMAGYPMASGKHVRRVRI